jgi:RNA polymerase-binding protein DksA
MLLTAKQILELEQLIARRGATLANEMREDLQRAREESYGALAGPAPDLGDASVADLLADLDQAEVARDVREIREIDAARARLADGSYGICADCGAEIEFERLRAHPIALRCFDCQRVHEKTHVRSGE